MVIIKFDKIIGKLINIEPTILLFVHQKYPATIWTTNFKNQHKINNIEKIIKTNEFFICFCLTTNPENKNGKKHHTPNIYSTITWNIFINIIFGYTIKINGVNKKNKILINLLFTIIRPMAKTTTYMSIEYPNKIGKKFEIIFNKQINPVNNPVREMSFNIDLFFTQYNYNLLFSWILN